MRGWQACRNATGGLIERGQPLSFRFDGREFSGFAGDTLASALMANGVRLVGRSFKYHRPRGILTAGSAEPNALVELRSGSRREPNTRATTIELFDGLEAVSQNRWPSLAHDLMAVNGLLSPFLVAGFYYKTFKWPASFWYSVYERVIRRAAGLGRAAERDDPDRYEKAHAHCDVLVVGGGPAGLTAALAAGRSGARVILADDGARPGGALLAERIELDGEPGVAWLERVMRELDALKDVRVMPRTTVFGAYDGGVHGALERVADHVVAPSGSEPRQRLWRIYARRVVLATGASERLTVFSGNDLPGVMLAGAARAYVNRFAARPGERAVVFGASDDLYRTAADLEAGGIEIAAIVDQRAEPGQSLAGARVLAGHVVSRAIGRRAVRAVEVHRPGDSFAFEQIACDLLCVAGGWSPNIQLATHLGARPVYDEARTCFVMGDDPDGVEIVGAASGVADTGGCFTAGEKAGRRALEALGIAAAPVKLPEVVEGPLGWANDCLRTKSRLGKAFVDLQNDVTDKDLALAVGEGYASAEHAKRYTTLGMATDQGRSASVNAAAVLADALGAKIADVGTTTARPPYAPIAIGALAGHSVGADMQPTRKTPMHAWHEANGAVFMETGLWLRPQYYIRDGRTDWLVNAKREARATRQSVGISDVSTLGKIDIQGPDAATFLNRLYINGWSKLAVGRARYGLMLREDGFVMDDGTTARLGEEHFLMTTTTANAGPVMAHMEFCHQVHWPDLDVQFVSVSEQWAQIAVAGPNSRAALAPLVGDLDLSNEAFAFMSAREISFLGGIEARLFRISFSGELAYELAVPADYGIAAWEAIMASGKAHGITPYGMEALSILRIEKGHATGAEIDGRTTAHDLGFGRMMSKRKDYIGRRMAEREAFQAGDRRRFVGFAAICNERLHAGAHLLPRGAELVATNDQGWISSVAYSPERGRWIGLGFLERGPERIGEELLAAELLGGRQVAVEVCNPVFFDPEGKRLHG